MKFNFIKLTSAAAAAIIALAGCSSVKEATGKEAAKGAQAPVVDQTPVTLKVWSNVPLTDNDKRILLKEPLQKKYPFITLEFIENQPIDTTISAGIVPDLILATNGYKLDLADRDLLGDITPLLTKYQINLSRFDSYIVDGFKSEKGELYALPYSINSSMMLYNKDIFDKFGVSYPKDGLTWEQAIDLGKTLTRKDQATSFRGIDPESVLRLSSALSLVPIDRKTGNASANTAGYKRVFELLRNAYSITGNLPPKLVQGTVIVEKEFMGTRNVAMFPTVSNTLTRIAEATQSGLNWDIAQYPSYAERPNMGMYLDAHGAYVTKNSKYKDQALRVLEAITSDGVQTASTRSLLRITTLANAEIKKQFGADVDFIKNKNVAAIYKTQPSAMPELTRFQNQANNLLNKKFEEYMMSNKDVNTILREADEEINKLIAQGTAK